MRKITYIISVLIVGLFAIVYNSNSVSAATSMGFSDQEYTDSYSLFFDSSQVSVTTPVLQTGSVGNNLIYYDAGYQGSRFTVLNRVLEYRVKLSPSLAEFVDGISVESSNSVDNDNYNYNNKVTIDSDGQKVFSAGVLVQRGNSPQVARIILHLKDVGYMPIDSNSYIATYMSSKRIDMLGQEIEERIGDNYTALRILNANRLTDFEKHNDDFIKNKKPAELNRLKEVRDSLIRNAQTPNFIPAASSNKLTAIISKIYDDYYNMLQKKRVVSNQDLTELVAITNEGIAAMQTAYDDFTDVFIEQIADFLDFGTLDISAQPMTYQTTLPQRMQWRGIAMKAESNYTVRVTMSDLYHDGKPLGATYLMEGRVRYPEEQFWYGVNKPNTKKEKNLLIRTNRNPRANNSIKLIVPPGRARLGKYQGTATWTVTASPV